MSNATMKLKAGQDLTKEKCPYCENVGEFYQIFSEKLVCIKCEKIIGVEFV
jgi:hypothetical protein